MMKWTRVQRPSKSRVISVRRSLANGGQEVVEVKLVNETGWAITVRKRE
ncbi:MAG: hypothetical protein AB1603_06650 [Chloroflexota bacterium]